MRNLILILPAAFLLASIASISAPALAETTQWMNPPNDDLGVDITGVTPSPDGVRQFLATLTPDGRRAVAAACVTWRRYPASAAIETLAFCRALAGT